AEEGDRFQQFVVETFGLMVRHTLTPLAFPAGKRARRSLVPEASRDEQGRGGGARGASHGSRRRSSTRQSGSRRRPTPAAAALSSSTRQRSKPGTKATSSQLR